MPQITIEGSRVTPSVVLAPGVRKTVALTPRIRELLRRGYVIQIGDVIEDSAPTPAPVVAAPVWTATTVEAAVSTPVVAAPVADVVPPTDEHPPYNADRAAWAAFLDGLQPPIPYDTDDGRDDLINRWQQSVGGG